ncbi:hypothetical protein BDQ12DRAFT_714942 [Crucibulum laeve]|uniref:Uncharacterized protein n=1 Tax=Crucibulum laeve TaxID=68775 RepID=A0A5C3LSN5_9AGAR|nr:hypothetical protein BDQ12DRAFT_714942 [Crucibulum laeve]
MLLAPPAVPRVVDAALPAWTVVFEAMVPAYEVVARMVDAVDGYTAAAFEAASIVLLQSALASATTKRPAPTVITGISEFKVGSSVTKRSLREGLALSTEALVVRCTKFEMEEEI